MTTVSCRERSLPKELNAEALIVDKAGRPRMPGRFMLSISDLLAANFENKVASIPAIDETSICRLVLTSGTTGAPKAVAFSHAH